MKSFFKMIFVLSFVAVLTVSLNKIIHSNVFNVKSVEIIGTQNADKHKLKKYFSKFLGKNIFEIQSDDLPKDIWVRKFEIVKKFPSKVVVRVFEKKPLFKYEYRKRCFYKLSDGSVIRASCKGVNVKVSKDIDDDFLMEFAKIYEIVGANGMFYLDDAHFELKSEKGIIYGFYDSKSFLENYRYYKNIKDRFYKSVRYANLMVNGKIYISGVRSEIR